MLEPGQISLIWVVRVLQDDDVLSSKRLVRQEISPKVGLDVQSIHRVFRKDVASLLDGYDRRMVRKNPKC
jgi:hypothetical protein